MNIVRWLLGSPITQSGGAPDEWDDVFGDTTEFPPAPGTEDAQRRHKALRVKNGEGDWPPEDEAELNRLFYVIYPQFRPGKEE